MPPSAPASAAKRPTPGAPTAIPSASDGGKAAKKTERNLFDVWSQQARTNRVPKHYTKWSFDIRAPPKCRLCSQRSEHGSSLVSLTGHVHLETGGRRLAGAVLGQLRRL